MWQTATKSVRISISVPLLARAQGDPAEWPLWTRRTGVCLYLPCPEMYAPRAGEVGFGQSYLPRPAELLNSKLAHAIMTVAVKAASHVGTVYVAAAAEDCSRLVGVCRDLCFFLSLFFPLFSRA